MAGEGRFGAWNKLRDMMRKFDERLKRNARKALLGAGEELASDIRSRIIDGKDMKPLHPFTVEQKGSSKPLIDDGDLLGSVGVRFVEDLAVAVGVHKKAEDGTDIAALHEREEGTRIRVTDRMRAYLAAKGLHLKPETTEIFIPGRPYMKPALEDFKKKRTTEKFAAEMIEDTLEGKG